MKIRIIGVLLICLTITSLYGCQKVNENKGQNEIPGTENPDDYTNTDDTKNNSNDNSNGSTNTNGHDNSDSSDNTNSNINDVTSIIHFVSLIGLTDQEVVNIMGQGTGKQENVSDPVVTREYPLHLRDNTLTAIVSYDNKGIVQGVYSFLPDTEKEKWVAYLTEELGKPTRVESGNLNIEDGNYITNVLWMVKGRIVSLYGSHGSLSIQIE